MPNYTYVDKAGANKSVNAASENDARKAATDIAPTSGFQSDTNIPETLTSTNLTSNPAFKVTASTTSTGGAALGAAIGTQADQFNTDLQAKSDAALAEKNKSKNSLLDFVTNQEGKTQLTDAEYKATGVDAANSELKDINNQITAEQNSLNHAITALDKNPGGMTRDQVDAEKARLTRESVSKQADLSVIQLAKQGKFDSAKAIADRVVAVKFEQQQNELAALQLNYEDNKDLFTTSEQRAFESAQSDRKRILDQKIQQENMKYEQVIKQSDPLYQLQVEQLRKQNAFIGEPTAKEKAEAAAVLANAKASLPAMYDKLDAIEALKNSVGIGGGAAYRVGTGIGRGGIGALMENSTGSGQSFAAAVHQLVNGMTLQNLIQAKAQGATFGALSDAELSLLANSASKINDWEVKNNAGQGTGYYDIDEVSFNKELDQIKTLTQRAIVASGQSLLSPEDQTALTAVYNSQPVDPSNYYGK